MKINIKNNPFKSDVFTKIWLKWFGNNNPIISGNNNKLKFIKHNIFPFYFNVGKNFTNGITYNFNDENNSFFKNKIFLIYDVPNYSNCNLNLAQNIKIKKINQYGGVLTNLNNYSTIDSFLKTNFKSKKRAELVKFKKRLEHCYKVEYDIYSDMINKVEFDNLFYQFYQLLVKRYSSKGISNRNLSNKFKNYYKDLIFSLINNNKAILFVLKADNKPISMSLSFISENVVFYAIPVFDIEFSKFNLGHTSIMVLLDWCITNDKKIFDFSKGDGVYKDKWVNLSYKFENHIIYDSSNNLAKLTSNLLYYYFKIKQQLREANINSKIQKLSFKFKHKKVNPYGYKIIENNLHKNEVTKLQNYKFENPSLNIGLNDFLYKNSAIFNQTEIYLHKSLNNTYFLKYKDFVQTIETF